QTTVLYDGNGDVLAEFSDPREGARKSVPLSEISPWVLHATISTEDETFYENPGFSIYSILRAVYRNTTTGGLGGGASTITQQITRALVLDPELAQQRTNTRKVQEIIVAAEISRQYSKNEILEFYLNEIYYGNRAYGIEAASQTYFGKSAKDLNIAEAAFLAGLPQSPATYDPVQNRETALARMDDVLRLMTEANGTGCIQMQHEPYNTEPLCVTQEQLENDYAVQIAEVKIKIFEAPTYEVKYPHFVNYVWQNLEETYSAQRIYSSGFQVYTTLIPSVQDAAQAAVDFQLRPGFTPNANNASVVAMRPSDGAVIAMVGSADFYNEDIDGQVNVAFSMQQPGSAIKPLVYLTALEGFEGQSWYPGTVIWDVSSNFNGYTPRNYSGTFNGPVTMRYSVGQSLNIPAVKTLAYVTPQRLTELMDRLKIRMPGETPVEAGLPSSLGAVDVYLFDMVRAYGALANNGVLMEPYAITRILDRNDNEVYVAETNPQGVQVIRPEYAYLITDIMADPSVRFSTELNLPGWRAAGKTGTTNDVRDVWTVGYTTDAVVGVWVGRTDNQPLGPGVTSGNTAAPIWQQVMTAALSNITPRDFPRPDGIIEVQVCADSGALFNPSTCPSGNAISEIAYVNQPPPNEGFVRTMEVDSFSGLLAN
ncbi:MAG: transglycosylase domain-containing protein, partial [Anaerolineae bacterium]|nr:transglycosylase domain-containing protein [Anaerolineae bacterium]